MATQHSDDDWVRLPTEPAPCSSRPRVSVRRARGVFRIESHGEVAVYFDTMFEAQMEPPRFPDAELLTGDERLSQASPLPSGAFEWVHTPVGKARLEREQRGVA